MRITREIIESRHRWRAIDDRRMAKICKDVKKLISDFLGPQITLTQTSIREYIERECNQCAWFTCPQERNKCEWCPQEICAFCYHEPKVDIYQNPQQINWDVRQPFLCRPCHKESCCLDRNAWALIKEFMIARCECCDEMITATSYKCGYCKKFWCHDQQPSQITDDDKHMCWDCQVEFAQAVYANREPNYTGECRREVYRIDWDTGEPY